ncbi:MAG: TraM recognition domain-containing protein, partial [Dehalococcoidia bacterium]|nr:TraM recognition domain-containing protein [Dehalococcoidia bacterium]
MVVMLHRLWPDNWGPRMEGALRASLLCLHEANQARRREEQYTLLDVVPMLSSADFRADVLKQAPDLALWAWWRDNYDNMGRALQQQTANPVTTKVGRFLVTQASRVVVGQARSTFDPRPLLKEGGVLVVNSAVGLLGEGAASLVGATVLNLLGLIVEEQVALPPGQRSRLVALVDESSTLGAADYPRMLSELGKYGASFVLVTQSLAKLDAIDEALRPT